MTTNTPDERGAMSILWRKVVTIAYHQNEGMKTGEIIIYAMGWGADRTGIPSEYKKNLREVLEFAGFEMIKKYRHSSRKTERLWVTRPEFSHHTLEQIITRYENKLIDQAALKALI